jgi:DNA-binding beta-propeller fold protein YncE
MSAMSLRSTVRFLTVLLLAWVGLALLPLAPVRADGGAPNLAYVAGGGSGVSVIDIVSQQVKRSLTVGGDPHMAYLSLDGSFLYVAQPELGEVSKIAASSGQILCSAHLPGQPSLLAFDPGPNVLYAAGNQAALVNVLNPTDCTLMRTIPTQSNVYGLAVAVVGAGISGGKGNQLWVSESNALVIFNATGGELARIPLAEGPEYITIPLGSIAYIVTRQHSVMAVNLGTRQIYPTLFQGGTFGPMDYDAITGDIYVPDTQSQHLYVLSPIIPGSAPPTEPEHVFELSAAPQAVAITSDGQFGFVALNDGGVAMLDIPARQQVTTFHVGGTPHFIITGLYPPASTPTSQQGQATLSLAMLWPYAAIILVIIVPVGVFWLLSRRH